MMHYEDHCWSANESLMKAELGVCCRIHLKCRLDMVSPVFLNTEFLLCHPDGNI